MKKKSIFFCIALTVTISVSSQTPNQHTRVHRQNIIEKKVAIRKAELHTDVENENLKGKVKEFTDTEFKASKINGKIVKGKLFQSRVDEYDTSGNLTSRAYYDSSMKLFMKTLYTYSKRGLKTKEVLLDNKQEVVLTKTYEYDANDYLTTEITFHRNGDQSNQVPYTYQYPDEYTVIQITTTPDVFTGNDKHYYRRSIYNDDGTLKSYEGSEMDTYQDYKDTKVSYVYNDKKQLIGWKNDKVTGEKSSGTKQYDDKGNVTKITDNSPGYPRIHTDAYTYDNKGNWITMIDTETVTLKTPNEVTYKIYERKLSYY